MLDLLLTRALQATGTLCRTAHATPTPEQLEHLRRTDAFTEYMYDTILHVAAIDGREALTERKGELVFFGKLLSYVLWQLEQRQLTLSEYYNLLLEELDG